MATNEKSGCCTGGPTLIFACSGAADVGAIADQAARKLSKEGAGKMFCLAGIGGRVPGIVKTTEVASKVLAIDGCPLNGTKNTLEQAGFKKYEHLQVADLGMEKGKTPPTPENIAQVAAKGAEKLMKNSIAVGVLLLALCAGWLARAEDPAPAGKATKIMAYYFHGTARCPTCMKLESYTREAIGDSFKDELKDGRIEWRVVNTDEDSNKHFVKDFKLETKSVVLVAMQGDRQLCWKNLDKIWDLVESKDEFKKYIRKEVSEFRKKD